MAVLSWGKPIPLFIRPAYSYYLEHRSPAQAKLVQARWDARKEARLLAKLITAPTNGLAKPKRL